MHEKQFAASDQTERGVVPEVDPWEAAYLRFETPKQELQKFLKRLRVLGADQWPRDAKIVELFCGRGNSLRALERLGFTHLEGIDLSAHLLAQYKGNAKCYVGDCRQLPFANASKDVMVIQGGLHHLPTLPDDLDQTLAEIHRVLRKDGRLVVVEPWLTTFLTYAHVVSENRLARRFSRKLDALATMIHYERRTYEQWLGDPALILTLAHKYFTPAQESFGWGKWNFVGTPRQIR